MLVINLFGAPGSGKSTLQADIFRRLKQAGVNAEILPEYAKKLTWEGRWKSLNCQPYIFGKTLHDIRTLDGQIDVLVLDSPLFLCAVYDALNQKPSSAHFGPLVAETHKDFGSMNYMLTRTFAYATDGRRQDAEQADVVATLMRALLDRYEIDYRNLDSDEVTAETITAEVLARLRP